ITGLASYLEPSHGKWLDGRKTSFACLNQVSKLPICIFPWQCSPYNLFEESVICNEQLAGGISTPLHFNKVDSIIYYPGDRLDGASFAGKNTGANTCGVTFYIVLEYKERLVSILSNCHRGNVTLYHGSKDSFC